MKDPIGAAVAGAVGGGLVTGGLLGLSVALMDPAMPQGMVLIGTAVYGGVVCGGILGALVGFASSEPERHGGLAVDPEATYERP
ncbi:MAG TPA: hypothetical protein VLS53_03675 [Candidatus Dormibacteraeota bacterium]|nr:hypothetical protein [Candidatus Dormibacteraeota bacterium]